MNRHKIIVSILIVIAAFIFQGRSFGVSYGTLYSQEKALRDKNIVQYSRFKSIIDGYDRLFKRSPNSYKGALAAIRMLDIYRYLARRQQKRFDNKLRQTAYEIINRSKNSRARAFGYFSIYQLYKRQRLSTYMVWEKKLLNEYPKSWEAKLISKNRQISKKSPTMYAILQPLSGKVIVIDPGHGGKDPGASGDFGIKEKNLVLEIAKKVANKLKKKGATVLLTRSKDRFITLEKRAEFANRHNADAFVSIHANASPNKMLSGIETFFLTTKADKKTLLIASRENGITPSQMNLLQRILVELVQNAKIGKSRILAKDIQDALIKTLSKKIKIKNLGVRQAPFYVLAGTKIPSVLIETGFITNRKDARLLLSKNYQNRLADGIVAGIESFFNYSS